MRAELAKISSNLFSHCCFHSPLPHKLNSRHTPQLMSVHTAFGPPGFLIPACMFVCYFLESIFPSCFCRSYGVDFGVRGSRVLSHHLGTKPQLCLTPEELTPSFLGLAPHVWLCLGWKGPHDSLFTLRLAFI